MLVVYRNMATLQRQKGKYWYIVESRRVNGKPRPVPLAYLGTAENLFERLKEGKMPVSSKSYEYGTVAVMAHFIDKLNIIDLFNTKAFPDSTRYPKRNGLDFGQTMAAMIIQRAVHPSSKRAFSRWAVKTFLPQLYAFDSKKITSQHFWDMMDMITVEQLRQVEKELTTRIVQMYNIKLDLLLYDYTNFFTFIDTNNKKSTLTKRGKNKQKRNDLRQFCLALLVVREHRIPLFSDIYEGNKNDSVEFGETIGSLQQRIMEMAPDIEAITIVFDKGNNSKENFKRLKDLHFVAGLNMDHHKEAKEISYSKFYNLKLTKKTSSSKEESETIKCYRKKMNVWGEDRTVVIYKSEKLFQGQLKGLKEDLKKIKEKLVTLEKSGKKGFYKTKCTHRKAWTYDVFEKQIEQTINKTFVKEIIDFSIRRLKNNRFGLSWKTNKKKYEQIKKTRLGKRVLITSRHDWSDEAIIKAYHGQADVEKAFKQIKNPFHNSVCPPYHWTDQKVCVHTFCSLLSLTISSLMEMVARQKGFQYSINEIFDRLSDLRKAKYVYERSKKKYEVEYNLEEVEEAENLKLFECLTK